MNTDTTLTITSSRYFKYEVGEVLKFSSGKKAIVVKSENYSIIAKSLSKWLIIRAFQIWVVKIKILISHIKK